jgi:carbon-monoxide dehydrogenase small subunit
MTAVSLTINGLRVERDIDPRTSLADFLRLDQRLTGTHLGCEHGVCGACTIMLDGAPARSCIAFTVALDGAEVRTVEGFDGDPVMAKLREAFHLEHALQCGFCTPGMLITARDIVTRLAAPDEQRIRTELAGNLCRCTGYMGIVNAIQRVIREMPHETRLGHMRAPATPIPATPPFRAFTSAPDVQKTLPTATSADWDAALEPGWSRITDEFVIERPRAEVWRLFADLPRMARAMPGAEIVRSDGSNLAGRMIVALGPIRASFAGDAAVERDEATMSGRLSGGGSEPRGSRAKGRVRYRLIEHAGGAATRVELALDYQLQGPLAQFSRSGLVKDFAARLIAEFVRNLASEILDPGAPDRSTREPLKAGTVFWAVAWARMRRWLGL